MTIEICMGSSCYARGNRETLSRIEEFIRTREIGAEVELKGCLCAENCGTGPIVRINGSLFYEVVPEQIEGLLQKHLVTETGEQS